MVMWARPEVKATYLGQYEYEYAKFLQGYQGVRKSIRSEIGEKSSSRHQGLSHPRVRK